MLTKPHQALNKAFLKVKPHRPEIELFKANKILDPKKAHPKADTSALEAEIDRQVYQLYDLTDEEIEIVEGSVK